MTIEERLREALDGYCPSPNYPENLLLELAARGLAVCEVDHARKPHQSELTLALTTLESEGNAAESMTNGRKA